MLEKTLEELETTPGGQAAKKIRRQNFIVKIGAILAVIVLVICGLRSNEQGNQGLYFLCMVLILLCAFGARLYFARLHLILQTECDPYKAEEVYTYLYKKKGNKCGRKTKQRYCILIARCIAFEEKCDRTLPLLMQINPEELTVTWRLFYYDCLRMYYGRKREGIEDFVSELAGIRSFYKNLLHSQENKKRDRKAAEDALKIMDLSDAMEQGDLALYRELSGQKEWYKGAAMTVVAKRFTDAKASYISKEYGQAKKHCYRVITNGNRLYYVGLAEKMLERINEKEKYLESEDYSFKEPK